MRYVRLCLTLALAFAAACESEDNPKTLPGPIPGADGGTGYEAARVPDGPPINPAGGPDASSSLDNERASEAPLDALVEMDVLVAMDALVADSPLRDANQDDVPLKTDLADAYVPGGSGAPPGHSHACNNGVLEIGETCDPSLSCPATCDDGNSCTLDRRFGSAASCNVVCTHAPIIACKPGDACCPMGCNANTDTDCSDSCGNGVLGPVETCDPPSSCPRSCDDGNSCTADLLVGSAAGCSAVCAHVPIVVCLANDGCCPRGCTHKTDPDCSDTCGDGIQQPGETCDPPSSCAASCDDANSCTVDRMTGSAANCSVACTHTAITACTGNDGCCPARCTNNVDPDCPVVCGNGAVETGETCDPPRSCPTSCDDGISCTDDAMSGKPGDCNVTCSHTWVTACRNGDGCCPSGCDSTRDSDCAPGT